jgi:hypothetical protein
MRPVLSPEYIYAHPHQEQDVILWYNRAVWHSIVSLPRYPGSHHWLTRERPSSPKAMAQESCINAMLQPQITHRRDTRPVVYRAQSRHDRNPVLP